MHIRTLQKRAAARQEFVRWLANKHPRIAVRAGNAHGFDASLASLLPDYLTPPTDTRTEYVTQSGTVAKSTEASPQAVAQQDSWWQSAVNNVTAAIPQLATSYVQAREITQNMKRADQGLPPVDYSQTGPTVRVQAGVDPSLMKYGLIGIALLGAAFVVPKLIPARSRSRR